MKQIIQFSIIAIMTFTGNTTLNAQFKNNHYGPFYMVTADALHVRAKADLSSRVVDRIKLGDEVMVLQTSDSLFTIEGRKLPFQKIRYQFNQTVFEGWVWSGFLTQVFTTENKNVDFLKYESVEKNNTDLLKEVYSINRLYKGEVDHIRTIVLPPNYQLDIHTQGNLGLRNINKAIVIQAWDSECCSAGDERTFVTLENYALDYTALPKLISLNDGESYHQKGYLFPSDALGDDKHIYLAKLSYNYEHHMEEPNLEKLKTYIWDGKKLIHPELDLDKLVSRPELSTAE